MESEAVVIAACPAIIDPQIKTHFPAQLLQSLRERLCPDLPFRVAFGVLHKHTDAPHSLRLLRARAERPCGRRAAEKRDELAAAHMAPRNTHYHLPNV